MYNSYDTGCEIRADGISVYHKTRTFAYIDGMNLYHAVDKFPDKTLKWLDIKRLVGLFCDKNDDLVVKFFTSEPPKYKGEDKLQRHRNFVAMLEAFGISVTHGVVTGKEVGYNCKCFL